MHFFIFILFLHSLTALAEENEKIKIDLKIELPKNSMLNLILKASSSDSAECIQKESSQNDGQSSNQKNLTKNEDKALTSSETNQMTNAHTTHSSTKSILFVRKFIKFCALDTNENSSTPFETQEPSLATTTSNPLTTTAYGEQLQSSLMVENIFPSEKTTTLPILEQKMCPENFRNYGKRCIYVSTEFKNWFEAKKKCEELHSRLIIPDTIFTFERVLLPVAYELNQDFWINAYFNVEFDEWLYPLNRLEISTVDVNQTNDLAFEKILNSQMIYIDPDENKEWFCNSDKLKLYSAASGEPKDNYLAMSWSEEFGRNCIDNFNLNSNKRVVCELV